MGPSFECSTETQLAESPLLPGRFTLARSNHIPKHVAQSFDEAKELTRLHGCTNWTYVGAITNDDSAVPALRQQYGEARELAAPRDPDEGRRGRESAPLAGFHSSFSASLPCLQPPSGRTCAAVAITAAHVLAGPIVRRVATDRVSVWVALGVGAEVTLSVYAHSQVAGAERTPLAQATTQTVRLGKSLFCALATVELATGEHLQPGLIYDYDISLKGAGGAAKRLGALGLLEEGTINGHRHLPLGYERGLLPSFVVAPAKAEDLVIAHGSCRRPYAQGLDAVVALDQIIERGREGPPVGPRPHYLFFTGDQIYADDLSTELLGWANQVGVALIGRNDDGHPIERLRVNLPDETFDRTVEFPTDARHFPPGRRQRLATRAAGLSSQDSCSHALSFGEIAAHYLFSWCNVLWPVALDDPAKWAALLRERGDRVKDYLPAWRQSHTKALGALKKQRAKDAHYSIPGRADVNKRIPRLDAWRLLPAESLAIDQFATARASDWAGSAAEWQSFWTAVGLTAPEPAPPATVGATANIPATEFVGTRSDLADLADLMTPAWYAGLAHAKVELPYEVSDAHDPLPAVKRLDIKGDDVLNRLQRLRTCYEALPYVRRALANVFDPDDLRRPRGHRRLDRDRRLGPWRPREVSRARPDDERPGRVRGLPGLGQRARALPGNRPQRERARRGSPHVPRQRHAASRRPTPRGARPARDALWVPISGGGHPDLQADVVELLGHRPERRAVRNRRARQSHATRLRHGRRLPRQHLVRSSSRPSWRQRRLRARASRS